MEPVVVNILHTVVLFFAAMIAGALNSVAGGGTFISYPALLAVGVPSIPANATNTVALAPGAIASVGAYRRELAEQWPLVRLLAGVSLLGGLVGAEVLLRTPRATFERLLPFLLLFATLLFIFSPRITARFKNSKADDTGPARPSVLIQVVVLAMQFMVAVYGGFFGAGIGIMMLAVLGIWGMTHIHRMNAVKTLEASIINGVAALRFIMSGVVFWPQAVVMIIGAVLGGYSGAYFARKVDPRLVRRFVIVVAVSLTVRFFWVTYFNVTPAP